MGGARQWKMPWQSFYLASVHQARPSEDHSRISVQPWWLLLSSRPRLQLGDEQWLKCPVARMGAELGADLAAHDKVRPAGNQSRTQNTRPCTAHHTFTLLLGTACKPRHASPQRAPASALHCLLDRWLASLDLYMAVCCDRLVLLTPPPLHAWYRAWDSPSGIHPPNPAASSPDNFMSRARSVQRPKTPFKMGHFGLAAPLSFSPPFCPGRPTPQNGLGMTGRAGGVH